MSSNLFPFLTEAKRQTYAAGGEPAPPLIPGSHQYEYRSGDWLYRDIYYGGEFFAGQEMVFYRNRPWWSMVYSGGVKAEQPPGAEIYTFLQSALKLVDPSMPYRGPSTYQQGEYRYACAVRGEPEWFEGVEIIFFREKVVYQLTFSGGMIEE